MLEQMITVAIIGIIAAAAGVTGIQNRAATQTELQRGRATQLMEYRASCVSEGRKPVAEVEASLSEGLPQVRVDSKRESGATTIEVSWKSARGPSERVLLTVLSR